MCKFHIVQIVILWNFAVSPPAGEWIEISTFGMPGSIIKVSPPAGEWIEIQNRFRNSRIGLWSLPLRESGLKSVLTFALSLFFIVSPPAGEWIEIHVDSGGNAYWVWSLPLRESGLKYNNLCIRYSHCTSLPLRESGLKC